MILSRDRDEDDMIVQCPNCKRMMIRKGRMIKSAKSLTCEACGNEIRLTYSYKMAIFENRRPPL